MIYDENNAETLIGKFIRVSDIEYIQVIGVYKSFIYTYEHRKSIFYSNYTMMGNDIKIYDLRMFEEFAPYDELPLIN